MSLTLDQIAKQAPAPAAAPSKGLTLAQIQAGGSPSPAAPAQKGAGSMGGDLVELAKGATSYAVSLAKRLGGEAAKGAEEITKTVDEQGKKYAESPSDAAGSLIEKPAILGQAVGRTAASMLKVAFSPLTLPLQDAVKSLSESISTIPAVQRVAAGDAVGRILNTVSDTGQTLQQIADNHPEAAKDVDAISTILLSVVGEKPAEAAFRTAAKTSTEAGKATVEAIPKVVDAAAAGTKKVIEAPGKAVGAAGDAAKVIAQPFRATAKPEEAALFDKYGIEAPISAVTSSRAIQKAEAVAQSSFFGGKITQVIEDARRGIADIVTSLQRDGNPDRLLKPGANEQAAGEAVQKALQEATDKFNETKTRLYDEATAGIGKDQAELAETRQVLDEIIAQKKASGDPSAKAEASYYQQFRNNLSTAEKRTFQNVKQTRTDVGRKLRNRTDPVTTGDGGNLKRLYAALSNDLDKTVGKYPEGAKALSAANGYYKAGVEVLNSIVGRTIKNARSPELLVSKLVRPKDVTSVRQLRDVVGEGAFKQVADAFFNKIISDATVSLTGKVTPARIASALAKYGDDVLLEVFGERGLGQLKDLRKAAIVNDIIEKATNADGKVMPGRLAAALENYDAKVLEDAFSPEELAKLRDAQKMASSMDKGTRMADGSPTAEKGAVLVGHALLGSFNFAALAGTLAVEYGSAKLLGSAFGKKVLLGLDKGSKADADIIEAVKTTGKGPKPSPEGPSGVGTFRYTETGGKAPQGPKQGGNTPSRYQQPAPKDKKAK